MKKILLYFVFMFASISLFSQWVQVDNGLTGYPPTSLYPMDGAVLLGTAGGGIFLTDDNGANWTDISGNMGNMFVNDVNGVMDAGSGYYIVYAATEDGLYSAENDLNYIDCSTGLTTRDANFWWAFGHVGTNGGGYFEADDYQGPWNPANNNISGDGMYVNAMAGYSDDEVDYLVLATDGGVYWKDLPGGNWTENTLGLSGDALKIKGISSFSTLVLIATEEGCYWTMDQGNSWTTVIPDVRFNMLTGGPFAGSPYGLFFMLAGETSYFTFDLQNWSELDLSGIDGEITAACMTDTDFYIGVSSTSKDGKESGGVYRIPNNELESVFVGLEESVNSPSLESLSQNFPNPVVNQTTINYMISQDAYVEIIISDLLGRQVQTLLSENQEAGNYSIQLNTQELREQIYLYSLRMNGQTISTKKMTIMR